MKKEFIAYEQALALKELGFDEPCFGYYHICDTQELKDIFECDYFFQEKAGNFNSNCSLLKTPLYQQAFRWFREKYSVHLGICHTMYGEFDCWTNDGDLLENGKYCKFKTYEEAELECIKKLIEIVKNK